MDPKPKSPWTCRRIVHIRELLVRHVGSNQSSVQFIRSCCAAEGFNIKLAQDKLRTRGYMIRWDGIIGYRAVLPQDSFCSLTGSSC